MLSMSKYPRAYIENNEWYNAGGEEDIECPPSAKRLKISYPNGDFVSIEFFEINSTEDAINRYPGARTVEWDVEFPLTAVEVNMIVANSGIEFTAQETKFGMGNIMKNSFFSHCGTALVI